MTEYGTWLDTLGFSDSVVYNNVHHIRDFFEWLENRQIHAINLVTQRNITEYQTHLEHREHKQKEGRLLGVSCLNQNFAAVDKLLEFLHQYGMNAAPVPVNYRITPDTQERILKIETFTQQEIKTLYNCISTTYPHLPFEHQQAKQYELRLIFALYYACGLRKTEAQNICFQDVDFDRKTVFVRQGKGGKDRIVPMSARVYNEIQDYIYNYRHRLKLEHNRLFISVSRTLSKSLKHLQSVCEDETIQLKRISPHILRHSIATHLLQNGMSIENIALFLGHTSLDSTQIYTHLV